MPGVSITVADPADPRLGDYADLRGAERRLDRSLARRGILMAEGELVVRQLLRSRFAVRSVLGTPARLDSARDALGTLPPGTPVYEAPQAVMNDLVGFDVHRGILAAATRAEPPSLTQFLPACSSLVVLETIANHDNLGGIFRNVAALAPGCGVILSPGCCDPLYRKAIRVSLGHALMVPFAWSADWPDDLEAVRAAGFGLVSLTPSLDADPIERIYVARPALLLGAEGPGLSQAALPAGRRVRIPLAPGVDSLNVAVACGIALHRLCSPGLIRGNTP